MLVSLYDQLFSHNQHKERKNNEMKMKMLAIAFGMATLIAPMAFGQSSGNFTYGTGVDNAGNPLAVACELQSNGNITGGEQCQQSCTIDEVTGLITCTPFAGTCIGHATGAIKTSSGSGNTFVVRPSAVVGLLTDVTVSSKNVDVTGSSSSSALAGIDFKVTVTDANKNNVPVIPSGWVTYDARYVQISTNLFTSIGSTCTTTVVIAGVPVLVPEGCFITFDESTVSAHSFDFIVPPPLSSSLYTVTTTWRPDPAFGINGIAKALACVGPVNMTVQQNKIFHFNQVN
jgi:hypothetical protein